MLTLEDCKTLCQTAGVLPECEPILQAPTLQSALLHDGSLYSWICETLSSGLLLCSFYTNYGGFALHSGEYIVSTLWAHSARLYDSNEKSCPDVCAYRAAQECEAHLSSLSESTVSSARVISNILSLTNGRPRTPEGALLAALTSLSRTLQQHKTA